MTVKRRMGFEPGDSRYVSDADDASEVTIVDTVNTDDVGDVNADGATNVTGW